jgi:P27 family predicted phage terminase small subunit
MTTKKQTAPPEPPDHLDTPARQKWTEVLPIVEDRMDADQGTLDALACYCQAWSRWTAAEQQVNELGAVVKSAAGFAVANPYAAIAAAAQRQMRQWAGVLGLHKRQARRKATGDPEAGQGAGLLKLLGTTTATAAKTRGRKATA